MSDAKQQLISDLDSLAQERFKLKLELDDANDQFKNEEAIRRAAHTERIDQLQRRIDPIDDQIWKLITDNRSSLIQPGKQSFAIMSAVFKLRRGNGRVKVHNEAGIMHIARRLKVVNKVADVPSYQWRFSYKKFLNWFNQNPKLQHKFHDCIEVTQDGETLTMQPNENYTVHHNSARISPPSVSIKKS